MRTRRNVCNFVEFSRVSRYIVHRNRSNHRNNCAEMTNYKNNGLLFYFLQELIRWFATYREVRLLSTVLTLTNAARAVGLGRTIFE